MKINDLLTCLIISLASTGELNLPLHIYILQHSAPGGSAVPPQVPFVAPAESPAIALTWHWLSGGTPALHYQCVVSRENHFSLLFLASWLTAWPPFPITLPSIYTPKKSHGVLISQIPTPSRQHVGKSLCTQDLRIQRSHLKSLHTPVGSDSAHPGMSICRWSGNSGAVGKSTVKGKLLWQEGL